MSAGDVWQVPGGKRALELSASTRSILVLAVIEPDWPFPRPPISLPREMCTRLPSRYLHGAIPQDEEALF